MPWRLIALIIVLGVFLAFITFNMDNRCDVSFGLKVYKDVPVFLTIFTSFVLGMLCALPIKLRAGKKRDGAAKDNFSGPDGASSGGDAGTDDKIKQDAASARERFFAKRRGNK